MKKLLLVAGVLCIAACIVFLLLALLKLFGYYHVLDGSAELYAGLHRKAIARFLIGTVLAVIGAGCLIVRARL